MTTNNRPDLKLGGNKADDRHVLPDSDDNPDPLSPDHTTTKKPKPGDDAISDGDVIGEVGDEVGGPA